MRAVETANAWKRVLLDTEKKPHADGKLVLAYLFRASQFFGRQFVPGNHDATVALAAKRQMVNQILALLGLSEAALEAQIERAMEMRNLEDEV